jgi:glycosyltransferase involved in cell wall biosynthesis
MLGAAIRSVLAQTRDDFELIVVDDGSSDATPAVARSFASDPRLVVVRQENKGLAAARNSGVARARGRYVAFLDHDDLWMPTYLEEHARALDADPQAGIAYSDLWWLDGPTGRVHRRTALEVATAAPARIAGEEFVRKLMSGSFFASCSMVRVEALSRAGGFDASLSAVEDWDLWIRIAALGYAAVRIPDPLVIYRDVPGSMSKDRLVTLGERRAILRKVIERYEVPEAARAAARTQLAAVERDLRALSGERSLAAAAWRARLRLRFLHWRIVSRLDLLRAPPSEVADAFPELAVRR